MKDYTTGQSPEQAIAAERYAQNACEELIRYFVDEAVALPAFAHLWNLGDGQGGWIKEEIEQRFAAYGHGPLTRSPRPANKRKGNR